MSKAALSDLNARRRGNGEFGNKEHGEPGLTLPGAGNSLPQDFRNVLAGEGVDIRDILTSHPAGRSEAQRKLTSVRGPAGGGYSLVELDDRNSTPARGNALPPLEVSGPASGRPVIVHATAGVSHLRVTSGKAIICADRFSSSNTVFVEDGAEALIYATEGAGVKVAARRGSKVTVVCESPENRIDVGDTSGEVTERFGPEAVTVPNCPDCGEAMEYGDCLDCYCGCGKPADDNGVDPNLCTDCNKEAQETAAAEQAADQDRAWAWTEEQRAKNEAWSAAMATARAHGIPEEIRRDLGDLVAELAEASSWRILDTAGDWARSRGYETGFLDYGPDLDSMHCHGAIFVDRDGDWQIGVGGVGRRNSAIDSDGDIDQMDYEGDEDRKIYPMQYILPWKKEQA